ncbi:M16 family metallopeptidase [Rheinheimera marina]|uniref:M16 family metallopeptidase n=1 Tax=Rheinheimera marina TaxID=1774958 RepID=A0ABV9JNL2_9GAMM
MKKTKLTLAIGFAIALAACSQQPQQQLPAGVKLIEQSAPSTGIHIPYKKYQLDNGLTVVVHEDNSDPLVHVDVTYHVGSAREEAGKSGFAHFFEHMMFQGSENVADEQHFKIVTESGGNLNGTTNNDRTNYFETVPANQLEKMLWLEADRMGFLLDAVTEKKFEVQRETVKNERGQRIDNQPYGRLFERVSEAMFPQGHPYSWPIIGYMDDLNRANVNDVKAFFLRWYGPNNATLTIGGDVKAEDILPLVNKYFGTIPRGPQVTDAAKQLWSLPDTRYISMEDNVHLPLLYISFPTVYANHKDEAALDILSEILGNGNNSLLYKNLVKTQLAVQAQVSHPCRELSCEFSLYALPNPGAGKNLADIEKIIRDSLLEFEQRGVTDDDLLKVKAKMEANSIFGLQSVSGKVSQLAASQTFKGKPDTIADDIARYNAVSKEDVMRVYQTYLKGKHSVVMSVVPRGQKALIAHADTFTPAKRDFGGPSTTKAEDLQVRKATDSFDRSKQPVAGANPAVGLPQTWTTDLGNGIQVLGSQSLETPTTSLLLKIPVGAYAESADKAGITSLMAGLMNESTKNYSTEQMSLELEKLGSSISFSSSDSYVEVFVSSLSKHLPRTLVLLEEKLRNPAFSAEDFARVQQQVLQGMQHAEKTPAYLAAQKFNGLLYEGSIAALPNEGTMASVSTLTAADIQNWYQQWFKPAGGQLIVVSDLPQDKVSAELKAQLADWQGQAPAIQVSTGALKAAPATIYLVDKPDAPQSEIRIGKRSLTQDISGEFYKAGLMNYVLGGTFNSRINLNLREDKGYTYGARAGFSGDKYAGVYTASAAVRADATVDSIRQFLNEINQFREQGIKDDELAFMRLAINQADALKYETPNAKLGFMAQILEFNLTPDFVRERNQIVSSISKEEINALAKKHLDTKDMVILVVGDAKTLEPQLAELGMPVKRL